MANAFSIQVRGVVQGVGFRPFVYRLARENGLAGWVLNGEDGVEIHLEGSGRAVETFLGNLKTQRPPFALIESIDVQAAQQEGRSDFTIRESRRRKRPTVHISPDLPVCDDCIRELFDPQNPRYHYPYINCTNCGPRYTVILNLPYDRPNTTMAGWQLDAFCEREYHDPANRRFHAQPVACPTCGPDFYLKIGDERVMGSEASVHRTAELLRDGKIVAIKGLGGYHLSCDAENRDAVLVLRDRKYRKEKPFALMAKDLEAARRLIEIDAEAEKLLTSVERPIFLAPAKLNLEGIAPDNDEFGVMLPYSPLHYLLFAAGAPEILVMTSANRSSEPIAYEDDEAMVRLAGIADAFLIGERPIARRVDDSVTRSGAFGPMILRRARGYAPGAVSVLPVKNPVLALGADLKNTVTLVVAGQAFFSQHIGDLDHYESRRAFQQTIRDLILMYEIRPEDLLVVHDAHPEYVSSVLAGEVGSNETRAVQHHRAHLASVIAERQEWDAKVIGVSFDGTGYGDDGTIWGGEMFLGSVAEGFNRVGHLRSAALAGGDAAAQHPVQAAAGFLNQLNELPALTAPPFGFPERYQNAVELIRKGVRTFTTTSMGRLFDAAAALLGFTREISFEGQAAMWLEHLARGSCATAAYPFPFTGDELDFRPLLESLIKDRLRGRAISEIARRFHVGVAQGICEACTFFCKSHDVDTVVLSGGVFQNELLLENVKSLMEWEPLQIWTNHAVPSNDGGISLGQAALAAFGQFIGRDDRQIQTDSKQSGALFSDQQVGALGS